MDGQVTAGTLVCAIPKKVVVVWLTKAQVAAAGSSQGRCIDVIAERTGARIGPEKLRNLSSHLAEIMEPQHEACQVQQLKEWIDEARKHSKNVTLAVSRDGVSLGIAPFGNFEMASVATLTHGFSSKGAWVMSSSQAVHEALSITRPGARGAGKNGLTQEGLVSLLTIWQKLTARNGTARCGPAGDGVAGVQPQG